MQVALANGADLPERLEFNPETNVLQGLPMAGEGGVYLLNLAASGAVPAQETPRAAGNFTIHVQDSSLSLEMQNLKHMPNTCQCGKEAPITCAEIILSAGAATLQAGERLSVVCRMAEFLHLDISLLTLLQHTGTAARGSHVLAQDTAHMDLAASHYLGLSWPVTSAGFALLQEFIQVLQHNMNSQHLSRLPGLSRPTNTFPPSYSSSMLRTEPQPTRILSSGTEELLSDKDLGTSGILPNVSKPTLESQNISGIKADAVEAPLVSLFNATSHLPSSILGVDETPLPSRPDPSTRLFPSSERLQFVESAGILLPFSASQELQTVTQGQANTSPKVVHSVKFLPATIRCLFFFPVPASTFYDEEDGNSAELSLQILPADGSPSGSNSWLQFNTSQQAMHGHPLEMDLQYSAQEFVLCATDSGGLTAWQSFTIELLKPPEPPCHLFTVRTKNSYSSFLRDGRRVALFLEQLSLFLNSSSPKDLSLMALQPGSTLISWYHSSLCASASTSSSWCGKEEIQQALEELRAPAGSASPHFIRAMLPEYRVDVTFSISYREHCTKPSPGPCSSTGLALQAKNDSGMRSPGALLSSVCAAAGVVLAIAVCWLCRSPRRIAGAQPVMGETNSQLSHADVELDALRPRKAPVHECRASLSPPLWIPPSGPLPSHRQWPRPIPHIPPPFQPPKYRLPPHYPEALTTQHSQATPEA
ncbi:hypothetical protein DUI87_20015 [Hirundo rustica rustica]|uniref:Peptidase S72 domain-containing protein n=1 Tax=Hirundo rustica rustica TaxID=333673 RepID=A0A3M0JUM1_HIRRU|nr:hypothetical protein DUI87_20015 [Hirundo rustica rustica]